MRKLLIILAIFCLSPRNLDAGEKVQRSTIRGQYGKPVATLTTRNNRTVIRGQYGKVVGTVTHHRGLSSSSQKTGKRK